MQVQIDKTQYLSLFQQFFVHVPNHEQNQLMLALIDFVVDAEKNPCFVLKGYAGTGKTSVLGALIKTLKIAKQKVVLMAPTGRAAKVLSLKSENLATTIHKRIYFSETSPEGSVKMKLAANKFKNTLFIIDEASMIGDFSLQSDGSVSRNLLEDVFQYVFSGDNCRLILLGDEGQLPPVGLDESPALHLPYLEHHFPSINFSVFGLISVERQQENSGILENATKIRQAQRNGILPTIDLENFSDVKAVAGDELIEKIESAYSQFGMDEVMVVTRSNKRANLYNQHIRNRILYMEDELCGGDALMVVRNNYFWLDPMSQAGFIANGDMMKVHRVRKIEQIYGFRFAWIEVSLIDYPELDRFETVAFLESLLAEEPHLSRERLKTLFFEIEKDFSHIPNKQKRYQEIMKTPHFNALQIKFAYAVTCHKSQGGQWDVVFVDHGYLGEEKPDLAFLRWLYTAFTRASTQLYTVNLSPDLTQSKAQ